MSENENKVGDGSVESTDETRPDTFKHENAGDAPEKSDEERYHSQQHHNSPVHHGGVAQIGEFDPELQKEEREDEDVVKAPEDDIYATNDPALRTLREEDVDEEGETDRDVDAIKEKQGDLPSNG